MKLKVVKAGITALRGIVANRATPNRPLPQGNDIQPGRTEEMVFVVTARLEGPQTGGEGSELSAWLGAGGVGNEPLKVYRGSVAKNKELPPRNKTDQPVLHLSSMLDQRQPRAVDMHNLAIQEGGHPLVDLSERPLNERQYSFWGFIHGGTFESLFEDPHLNARRRGAEQGMYGEDNEPRYNVLQLFDFDKEIELACEEIMGKNKVGIFTYAGLRASQRLSAKEKTAVQNRAVEGMRRFISLPYNAKMIVNGQQVSATGRYWFELDLRRVGGRGRRRTAAELAGLSQGVQQALRDLNRRVEE